MPINAKELRNYRQGVLTLAGIAGVLALPVWAHVAGTAATQLGQNGWYVSASLVWWAIFALVLTLTSLRAVIVAGVATVALCGSAPERADNRIPFE